MLRTRKKGVRRRPVVRLPLARRRAVGPPVRKPGLAGLLGWVDQTVLWLMRTRGHFEPLERTMRAVGAAGEWASVWTALGVAGAATDSRRRSRWLAATAVGPAAIGVNYAVKVGVGRNRPLIEEHPPLARAPSKLSFPSAHATSSVAAATALGRVAPHRRVPLYTLATGICLTRPYLGMHYPSDVVAGVALGALLGRAIPRLDEPGIEQRLIDLVASRARLGNATTDGAGDRTAGAVPGMAAGAHGAQ
jgi:membrane-associated phospholipid phosphatase